MAAGLSPGAFIGKEWREHVVDVADGRLDRRAYELCAAYELRSAVSIQTPLFPGQIQMSTKLGELQIVPAGRSFGTHHCTASVGGWHDPTAVETAAHPRPERLEPSANS